MLSVTFLSCNHVNHYLRLLFFYVLRVFVDSNLPSTPRDGALNKMAVDSVAIESRSRQDIQSRSLGSALFPDEDTDEGVFHTEVLLAVQR